MTPNLTAWVASDRSEDTARVIAEKPTTLTIQRSGAANFTQVVRLENMGGGSDAAAQNATISIQRVVITGYKDHPTIADTIIQRGDRFFHEGQMFDVQQVYVDIPNRFMALAEVVQ